MIQQNQKWALWCPAILSYCQKNPFRSDAFRVASLEEAVLYDSLESATAALVTREHNDQPEVRKPIYPVPVIETITEEIKAAHYASEQVWSDMLNRYMTIEHFRPAVVEKKRTVRAASLEWK